MKIFRIILSALVVVVLAACRSPQPERKSNRIEQAQLEEMFARMRTNTKWNVDGPMLWGYFFVDPSAQKLEQIARELEAIGYRVVAIGPMIEQRKFMLHVERVEVHTPRSLNVRNIDLYAIAEKYSVASYDGMDVGPVPAVAK
jgi:hypothetical protein